MLRDKRLKKRFKGAAFTAAVFAAFVLSAGAAFESRAEAKEIKDASIVADLSSDGAARWTLNYSGDQVVDRYEVKLARRTNGNWNENYKTVRTPDNEYFFDFRSTGQYKFSVRAVFIGGDYTTWATSEPVPVTSDDISDWSGGGDSPWDHFPYEYPYTSLNGYGPGGGGVYSAGGTSTSGSYTVYGGGDAYYVDRSGEISAYGPGGGAKSSYRAAAPAAGTVSAGWVMDGGSWKYRHADGTYSRNGWDYINENFYYFDTSGRMQTGWIYYNDKWYLCEVDGRMCTGWHMVNGKWYYMDASGRMQTGYITDANGTYYCDQSGARFEGGYNPDGHYFDNSGLMIK